MTKSCVICGEEFEARGFTKTCSKRCSIDLHSARLASDLERKLKRERDIYKLNIEERRKINREKYHKNYVANREKILSRRRLIYAANRDRERKYRRDYRAANLAKSLNYKRKFRANNPNHERDIQRNNKKTKTLLMLMSLPSAIKETVNQTTS